MIKLPALLLTLYFLAACSSTKQAGGSSPIDINGVPTEAGLVSGVPGTDGIVKIFRGIPFAAPPVGDLRWKAPQPVPRWEGVRPCDKFPPSAMQSKPTPFAMWSKEFMAPEEPLGEDCLYLNLWTAAQASGEKRPVIVWIHGGGFVGGSGSVPLYDGEEMAKKGVVFITINYRLGIFGFFAHPELSAESSSHVSGNYGILDQIAALRWVKHNVSAFGGDPGRVTIAGQSAGAFSVNALLVSPPAKGLFHRAIGQSGGMFGSDLIPLPTLQQAEQSGLAFSESLKASDLATLRSLPADQLMKAGGRWGMNIDGTVILPVYETFEKGQQHDVPLISGWNADDGVSFGAVKKAVAFRTEAQQKYGDMADEFLRLFPASSDEEAAQSQKLQTQLSFGWLNYRWAALQHQTGRGSFLYYFTRVPPGEPNYGAFHSAEFGYALKTLHRWDRPFTAWDHQLSDIMSSYWVNFAATGDPNGEGLPLWTAFDPGSPQVMEFGEKAETTRLPYSAQLDFLDRYQAANRVKK